MTSTKSRRSEYSSHLRYMILLLSTRELCKPALLPVLTVSVQNSSPLGPNDHFGTTIPIAHALAVAQFNQSALITTFP